MHKETDRFHHSLKLEYAMMELFGRNSKWDMTGGLYKNPKHVREALLSATKKIKRHLENIITCDDRLLLLTSLTIESLDSEIKELREDNCNELEIIACFLKLVAYLIGFDWGMGKTNRQVVYYQTLEQEELDEEKRQGIEFHKQFSVEQKKRVEIACMLYKQEVRVPQIARIMRISEPMTKKLLVDAGCLNLKDQIKDK